MPPPDEKDAMPLPAPVARKENHLRTLSYQVFERTDGLWDIDATIRDSKSYPYFDHVRGRMAPGDYIHNISVRLTFDDSFGVHAVVPSFDDVPYLFCQGGGDNAHRLVGANLMTGWRRSLSEALGDTGGCTHLREMLQNCATVAFQAISAAREDRSQARSLDTHEIEARPLYIGRCHAMAEDGPVIARYFPQFHIPTGDD